MSVGPQAEQNQSDAYIAILARLDMMENRKRAHGQSMADMFDSLAEMHTKFESIADD